MTTKEKSKKTKGDEKAAPQKTGTSKKSVLRGKAARRAKRAARDAAKPKVAGGRASLNDVRISAQKARLALGLIKGKQVEPALQLLQFTPKKSTALLHKLLKSAIANA